jgi:cysteine-rich repeat protein
MHKSLGMVAGAAALLLVASGPASAQEICVGDCANDGMVDISEIITCVNIALALSPLSTCEKCDPNGDGEVSIDELITAVNQALDILPCTSITAACGNDVVEDDEECDDGNNYGGDGCSKNCTEETRRAGDLDPSQAISVVQTVLFPIRLTLTGSQALTTGKSVDHPVMDPGGNVLTTPGEVPVVIKAEDVQFDDVVIPGLVCACVRGIPVPDLFGPGVSGDGLIGCMEGGLMNVNYNLQQDHNTTPGSPGNFSTVLANDPDCTASFTFPSGVVSTACLEGTGETCSTPDFEHIGVCNSPQVAEFSGGPSGMGSGLISNNTSISLLNDAGTCAETRKPDGTCQYADYGPDCIPCTDDDAVFTAPTNIPTTGGTAEGSLYDANNDTTTPQNITKDDICGAAPCETTLTGSPLDCSKLDDPDPNAALAGSALAACFPTIDAVQIGDNVNCSLLALKVE